MCLEVREKGATEDNDAKILQDQEAYFDKAATKFYPVLTMAESCNKSYAAYNKKQVLEKTLLRDKQYLIDAMPALQGTYFKCKSTYKAHLNSVNKIVEWTKSSTWDLFAKSENLRTMHQHL